jgi:hypothetical protein
MFEAAHAKTIGHIRDSWMGTLTEGRQGETLNEVSLIESQGGDYTVSLYVRGVECRLTPAGLLTCLAWRVQA